MITFADRYFQTALYAELDKVIEAKAQQLAYGYAGSFDDYRARVGYIQALRDVRVFCDKIMAEFTDKPKRTFVA